MAQHKLTKGIITSDLKDIIVLFLDFYSSETDLAIALYGPDGKEAWCVCEERFSPLCGFLKSEKRLWELCQADHAKRASINYFQDNLQPNFNMCHFGLWNINHPICHNDIFYGSFLTGQKLISQSLEKSRQMFEQRISTLIEAKLISNNEARILQNCFNNIDIIDAFPEESIGKLFSIEERLLAFIQDLLSRIKKITLLRHELHQPNIALSGSLTRSIESLKEIKKRLATPGQDTKELDLSPFIVPL